MNAHRTACILSAGIMLAATIPAFAHSPGPTRGFHDRQPQRVLVHPYYYRPVAREVVVRRPVYVERRMLVPRPMVNYALVPPPAYYWPPYIVRARPVYYGPAYYVSAAPALAASVPPPPPSSPAPPTAQPAPAGKSFTLSADALFDFNQATLKPEGRRQLDKLAADLKRAEYDVVRVTLVTVTGHTDRLGSAPYNMKLSMRRAETVKAYLVELGIPAAKIVTTGRGETNPVTKPGQCLGDKATKELIACLQPDRRVEVEVSIAK